MFTNKQQKVLRLIRLFVPLHHQPEVKEFINEGDYHRRVGKFLLTGELEGELSQGQKAYIERLRECLNKT